jgi:hypothetical protein
MKPPYLAAIYFVSSILARRKNPVLRVFCHFVRVLQSISLAETLASLHLHALHPAAPKKVLKNLHGKMGFFSRNALCFSPSASKNK